MRAIVSVATGDRHRANMERLRKQVEHDNVCIFFDRLPPGSPTHEEQPYAFKLFALRQAVRHGAKSVLWMDSSIVVLRPLEPLWNLLEQQGYWFSKNYDYNQGQFCNDEALAIMGVTREEAFSIPQVVGGCFGLSIESHYGREFGYRWDSLLQKGAFRGDRGDLSGSGDMTKFVGHRNDQSCASHVCHKLGMKLTEPPAWFAEQGYPTTEETILTVER